MKEISPLLKKLPNGWEKILAEEYRAGASDTEVRASLMMTKGLWDRLMSDPTASEFANLVEFGRMLAKAWWLKQARANLDKRGFNGNLWYMVMKNRYGYSDKTITTTKKEGSELDAEELEERIRRAVEKLPRSLK